MFEVNDVFVIMLLFYLEVRAYMTRYFGFTMAKRFEMVFLEFRLNSLLISTRSCYPILKILVAIFMISIDEMYFIIGSGFMLLMKK